MRRLGLLFASLPIWAFPQVTDNFSDGDFTQNPSWTGDQGHFKVSSSTAVPEALRPALQLDAPGAGLSSLSVACSMYGEIEWQFWIKISLNTSSGNNARIYLLASQESLVEPLDGYFLQFGGTDDSVDFFRQDSVQITHLLRLSSLFTGNSTNSIRMRVTRTHEGNWSFSGDPAGTSLLQPAGEVNDSSYSSGNHFGITFKYTSSNTTKFYFDDLYAGPLIVDTLPPSLTSGMAVNPAEIEIVFNEPVDQVSAGNETNYLVSPDIGQPYSAIQLLDPARVRLFFDHEMASGIPYLLEIRNIGDLHGNYSELLTTEISYYKAAPYDIIFTEIMADPTPAAGLPEYEFLEIFNRSEAVIGLDGWQLEIGSAVEDLPSIDINPSEYFILCGEEAVGPLQSFGRAIGFTSFVLSNGGTSLKLTDKTGGTICYLHYDPSWYGDEMKSEGGFSLEMTDLQNPCRDVGNWKASGHPEGGTPGRINFNAGKIQDDFSIDGICCVNDTLLQVSLSAAVDSLEGSDAFLYKIEPNMQFPKSAMPMPPDFRFVNLILREPVEAGMIYTLTLHQGMRNCTGEAIESGPRADFAWPEPCDPYDIVINEILFNPLGDGVDYIEIFNRSQKAILLNELSLVSVKETPPNPPDTQFYSITQECRCLLPGNYLVLTRDPEIVKSQYFTPDPASFLRMAMFPALSNDKGYVMLITGGIVVDEMHYSDEMHFIMLTSTEGVSLELISPERPGDDPGNWHSAAETSGFGTPGYQNSQHIGKWTDESAFSLNPPVFSPDGDGVHDQLGISFQFEEPGKLVTILIFSSEGMLTKTLVNNEMPGTSGLYSWNGTMEDRTPARDGIYIIYLEALHMDGHTSHYRKACVLVRRR